MNTGIAGQETAAPNSPTFPLHSLPLLLQLLLLVGISAFAALALLSQQYIIAGGLCVAVSGAVLMMKYPRAWLYCSIVLWSVWFRSSDKDVSILDVGLVAFYLGGLSLWFVSMIIQRRALARNFADQLILVFFGMGILNLLIAWLNEVDLLLWAREFLLFIFILYYFPIRELVDTRRRLAVFLGVAAVVIAGLGIANLKMYAEAANNAIYAFNILSSRVSMNETIFLGAALCSSVFLLYSKRWYQKAVFLALTVLYSIVLIASFTRGAWLTFIIGEAVIFLMVNGRRRLALGAYLGIGAVFFIVGILVYFPDKSDFILKGIESRFSSSAKGTQDISFNSRVIETEATIKEIYAHPLGGAGMGARVVFYDIIGRETSSPAFVHNAYLFIAYKFGIPMAIMFFSSLFACLARGLLLAFYTPDPFYRCVVIGASSSLLAALAISLTSNQFAARHGLSLIAVYLALIAIVDKFDAKQKQQQLLSSGAQPAGGGPALLTAGE